MKNLNHKNNVKKQSIKQLGKLAIAKKQLKQLKGGADIIITEDHSI